MGTRADFYVKRESQLQWLGSIAWDGYPEGIDRHDVLQSTDEQDYIERVGRFLAERKDASTPATGWPWPWNTSKTTDFAYVFDGEKVMASNWGGELFDPLKEYTEDEMDNRGDMPDGYWPDMKDKSNVQLGGKRSGLIVIQA